MNRSYCPIIERDSLMKRRLYMSLKTVLLFSVLALSSEAFTQTCQTCGPLGNSDAPLQDADAAANVLQDKMDSSFLNSLQALMLKNLEGEKSAKYLIKGTPEYVSDNFLGYSTNIFAGEAAKRAQKDYEAKKGKGSIIPPDQFNELVYKKAKELERGSVQYNKEECFEYDCLEPGCGERKRNAQIILDRIAELEAAKDSDILKKIRKLDTEIFNLENKKADTTAKVAQLDALLYETERLTGSRSKNPDSSLFTNAISGLKEYLVDDSPNSPSGKNLNLEPMLKSSISRYPTYSNKEILQKDHPRDYFKLDFKVEETQKVKYKQGMQDKQFNVKTVELDQNEIKMHSNNDFSLNSSTLSEKVKIPDASTLNAIYCESSASDLRPTKDTKGKTIKQGEFDYLNYELSYNRNQECRKKVIDHFQLTEDKVVTVKADGLSEKEIIDRQAAFYANKENAGKVQVFQKFKGTNGDGTSGYKSFYCASPAYVKNNSHLCPGEAIKSGFANKEELKSDWTKKYGYSSEVFENITHKNYPPSFQAFLNQKLKEDPNYQFDPGDLTPEQMAELDSIYDASRYVKMKVYHSPELVEPEADITYHQKICSEAIAIKFSPEMKPTGDNIFIYQSSRVRGDGLYGSQKDWGGVGCSF
jgi:hypothetical protein